MTIKILDQTGESRSAIARRLQVTEGAIRYRLKRLAAAHLDGRAKQPLIDQLGLQAVVAEWWSAQRAGLPAERTPNSELLHELLSSAQCLHRLGEIRAAVPASALPAAEVVAIPPGEEAIKEGGNKGHTHIDWPT